MSSDRSLTYGWGPPRTKIVTWHDPAIARASAGAL